MIGNIHRTRSKSEDASEEEAVNCIIAAEDALVAGDLERATPYALLAIANLMLANRA